MIALIVIMIISIKDDVSKNNGKQYPREKSVLKTNYWLEQTIMNRKINDEGKTKDVAYEEMVKEIIAAGFEPCTDLSKWQNPYGKHWNAGYGNHDSDCVRARKYRISELQAPTNDPEVVPFEFDIYKDWPKSHVAYLSEVSFGAKNKGFIPKLGHTYGHNKYGVVKALEVTSYNIKGGYGTMRFRRIDNGEMISVFFPVSTNTLTYYK